MQINHHRGWILKASGSTPSQSNKVPSIANRAIFVYKLIAVRPVRTKVWRIFFLYNPHLLKRILRCCSASWNLLFSFWIRFLISCQVMGNENLKNPNYFKHRVKWYLASTIWYHSNIFSGVSSHLMLLFYGRKHRILKSLTEYTFYLIILTCI